MSTGFNSGSRNSEKTSIFKINRGFGPKQHIIPFKIAKNAENILSRDSLNSYNMGYSGTNHQRGALILVERHAGDRTATDGER